MNAVTDESISLSLRLIKINELAGAGRLKEAEALLAPDGAPPENPVALHTLAAIVTKTGNYARALALWKMVLQRDAKNVEAREMVVAIETWMSRPAWFRFLPAGAAAAAVVIVAAVFWTISRPHPTTPQPATSAPTPVVAAPAPSAPAARPTAPTTPAGEPAPVRFQLPSAPSKPKRN